MVELDCACISWGKVTTLMHTLFVIAPGILFCLFLVDHTDSLPIPIRIHITSFSVSSLNLNISLPYHASSSSISAHWNVTLAATNLNRKLTMSIQNVKATVIYKGASVAVNGAASLDVFAQSTDSLHLHLTSAPHHRLDNWVAKSIAADQLRDDRVNFDLDWMPWMSGR